MEEAPYKYPLSVLCFRYYENHRTGEWAHISMSLPHHSRSQSLRRHTEGVRVYSVQCVFILFNYVEVRVQGTVPLLNLTKQTKSETNTDSPTTTSLIWKFSYESRWGRDIEIQDPFGHSSVTFVVCALCFGYVSYVFAVCCVYSVCIVFSAK